MVIVRLRGGIGNQLFQFAFGRAIALYKKDTLLFDLNYLKIDPARFTPRDFKLQRLNDWKVADDHAMLEFNHLSESGNA